MLHIAQGRWWPRQAAGNTAISSYSMAILRLLLGPCQVLVRLVSHTVVAYFSKTPHSECQCGAGKAIQGGTAAAEVPELLQKQSCFPSTRWERPPGERLGKQSPPGDAFKTATCRRCCKLFVFNRLVLEVKGKLQIHPEDNVKGQAGILWKRSTYYVFRDC